MKNIKLEYCEYSSKFLSRMHELNKQAIANGCDTVDIEYVKKGLAFAKHYHGSQMRKSGEPYYTHPIAVANIAADHIFKNDVLVASLLHDTVEDTELGLSEIEIEFGGRVAQMVDRLTRKIDPLTNKKMSAGECLIKALELGDIEVAVIKSCDRWHNTSTIESLSREKRERIMHETKIFFEIVEVLSENNIFSKIRRNLIENSSNVLSLAFQSALNQNDKKLTSVS